MRGMCSYCKNEAEVEEFENPHTEQVRLTCTKCRKTLSLYVRQRRFLPRFGCLGTPLLIVFGIISFVVFGWQVGIPVIATAACFGIFSWFYHSYYITKWEKELGTHGDEEKIKWCRTCAHFRRIEGYEDRLWQSEEMIGDSEIPCKGVLDARPVWEAYFGTERRGRSLYPKNCEKWTRK